MLLSKNKKDERGVFMQEAIIIIAVIALAEILVAWKTKVLGLIFPAGSLIYLVYEYYVKMHDANFRWVDLAFPGSLFAVTLIIWIGMSAKKRNRRSY